ncbi:plasmid replication protein [Lacticaseibacillus paracasei]|uniref:plasmid replication protein n=1 Tax=Lacticaseibacillus paracasei TaxID=1597 RepID=UPI0021C43A5C|nr:plasmid replication protein [Lacticaseibacillus paracasei]MCP9305870.1 plasmid replication protein [Lacticaseibacillus paracasei]MCP9311605.1 plasmid replication protein [Lacticaseibacillus paracasei]MCP9347595.1 plasmid replication protein [Lacticaseibacillus paracasei]MCP9367219.1 plasmid replication protein [Lacticaseibacillus paracasei]MCP9367608.1 plasmid replication protein [Lacticaseibacillus paracasei]
MDKQNETRRVMITLSDQAIAKLDQLVAEKQRELNKNPELAKYNLRVNKSNILEAMLSKNRTLKRKD